MSNVKFLTLQYSTDNNDIIFQFLMARKTCTARTKQSKIADSALSEQFTMSSCWSLLLNNSVGIMTAMLSYFTAAVLRNTHDAL